MSAPTLTFVGSGDAVGSGGRLQTCVHVEIDATHFLLDCGASAVPGLKRSGIDVHSIETILLTHLHGDHFGGIPFYILDAQFARRTAPLTIAGPPGTEERVLDAMDLMFPGLSETEQAFEITFTELDEERSVSLGPLDVTAFRVVHPSGAPPYALRVEVDDTVLGYSGDTEWTDSLVDAARETDVFICEAYFYEKDVPYHLDYKTLQSQRDALDCDRVIVTHMSDELLNRRQELELEYADDGKQVII
jgi:ribonuclease BN (tRNA processing enzyme)